jgi:three-Cys-motif partner protein
MLHYDRIGYWSLVKHDIIKQYASAYSRIISTRKNPSLYHVYIDAFAGSGTHIRKDTGEFVPGSPLIALDIKPPFKEYHFIDFNPDKVNRLLLITAGRQDTYIYYGDCNKVLLDEVFPKVRWEDFKRGLCLLDPYGLHLSWEVIQAAGQMRSIDLFINFPIADINRNVLRRNSDIVHSTSIERMNKYWGDDSWREEFSTGQGSFFGWRLKQGNDAIAKAFQQRVNVVAGFKNVSEGLPMRNSRGAIIYYLFFASQKQLAADIIKDIFNKHSKYHNEGQS